MDSTVSVSKKTVGIATGVMVYRNENQITVVVQKNVIVTLNDADLLPLMNSSVLFVEFIIDEGAQVTLITDHDFQGVTYAIALAQNAILNWFFCIGGVENKVFNIDIILSGKAARAVVAGIVLVKDEQTVELVINQRHRHADSYSQVMVKGLAKERGQFLYRGVISVDEGAKGTVALLSNKNMVVGSQARVRSQPTLEIKTDSVSCKHGTATAPLDVEQLFYLQSRGIDTILAKKILLDAFFSEFLEAVPVPELCLKWQQLVHE